MQTFQDIFWERYWNDYPDVDGRKWCHSFEHPGDKNVSIDDLIICCEGKNCKFSANAFSPMFGISITKNRPYNGETIGKSKHKILGEILCLRCRKYVSPDGITHLAKNGIVANNLSTDETKLLLDDRQNIQRGAKYMYKVNDNFDLNVKSGAGGDSRDISDEYFPSENDLKMAQKDLDFSKPTIEDDLTELKKEQHGFVKYIDRKMHVEQGGGFNELNKFETTSNGNFVNKIYPPWQPPNDVGVNSGDNNNNNNNDNLSGLDESSDIIVSTIGNKNVGVNCGNNNNNNDNLSGLDESSDANGDISMESGSEFRGPSRSPSRTPSPPMPSTDPEKLRMDRFKQRDFWL